MPEFESNFTFPNRTPGKQVSSFLSPQSPCFGLPLLVVLGSNSLCYAATRRLISSVVPIVSLEGGLVPIRGTRCTSTVDVKKGGASGLGHERY